MYKNHNENVIQTILLLDKFIKKFEKHKIRVIRLEKEVYKSNFMFFYFLIASKILENCSLKNIFINSFKTAEMNSPGASYYLAKKIVHMFKNNTAELSALNNKIIPNMFLLKEFIFKNSDKLTGEIILNAIELGGPDSTIICEENKKNETVIERIDNCEFNISIHPKLSKILFSEENKYKNKNARFVISDTFIERESEIVNLIEECVLNKQSLVIFCRGVSDNAIENIKKIMLYNKILIYIYTDSFQNNDPFKFNDLAESLELSVINIETQTSLLKDGIQKSKSINDIKLFSNKILFQNKNKNLINNIDSMLKEKKDDIELCKYLLERKRRLSSKKVIVKVSNTNTTLLQSLKDLLLSYKNICKYGLINDTINNDIVPYNVEISTNNLGKSLYENINKISFVIKV